jgi:hypothetical protein
VKTLYFETELIKITLNEDRRVIQNSKFVVSETLTPREINYS